MNNRDKFKYITEGPILSSMLKLAFPIMLSQLLQTLYNLVDTLWVGRLGADAVAAISIGFPVVFLTISVAVGLTIAGTTLIAQHKGAENLEEVDKVLGQLIFFVGIISILLGLLGFTFADGILSLMGAEELVVKEAAAYLRVIFVGMPFMFGFFIFSATLRGIGDTVTPAIMMVVSVLLNIILDPLLIFGVGFFPKLGLQGAAIATVFSRAVVAIYALFLLIIGDKGVRLHFNNLIPDLKIIKLIIKLGIPSSVEQSMVSLGQLFLTGIVASYGTMTVAAYGIVNRVISLPSILAFGLSSATTTMVGQNIGAEKKKRAEKIALASLLTILLILTLLGAVMILVPQEIIKLFNDQKDVVKYGTDYLRVVGLTFGFMGTMIVGNGIFKGAGRTIPPMFISVLSLWILRIPLAKILAKSFNLEQLGLWWAVAISHIGGAVLIVIWLKVVNWSTKVIDRKEAN